MADSSFFKYPRTKHIFAAGTDCIPRDDLLMTTQETTRFCSPGQRIVIEEKVDGANLGFSINSNNQVLVQNRSHFVNSKTHKQFSVLDTWIEKHSWGLFAVLRPERDILFGEWLYAKHSIHYTSLPDYFLAFDIFDKLEKRFFSTEQKMELLGETDIACVRTIADATNVSKEGLLGYLDTQSDYHDGPVEGVVVRRVDSQGDHINGDVFENRGKVVRADFIQQIGEFWAKQKFTKNVLTNYSM